MVKVIWKYGLGYMKMGKDSGQMGVEELVREKGNVLWSVQWRGRIKRYFWL